MGLNVYLYVVAGVTLGELGVITDQPIASTKAMLPWTGEMGGTEQGLHLICDNGRVVRLNHQNYHGIDHTTLTNEFGEEHIMISDVYGAYEDIIVGARVNDNKTAYGNYAHHADCVDIDKLISESARYLKTTFGYSGPIRVMAVAMYSY